MRSESWVGAVAICLVLLGVVTPAEQQPCPRTPLTANMTMAHGLARVLEGIRDRSPTFRAQCERLASADNLRVVVRLNTLMPGGCRAFTIIKRVGHQVHAEVHLPPGRLFVELVAHEFEHLLEQVEGLNLRALARTRGSGVREINRELFESDRAIRAGRVVAEESLRPLRAPSAD